MKKEYNYNYVFLFYDIKEELVYKIFKICKKYLEHHQKSIFRGEITPSNILKLEKELEKIIDDEEDFITILKMFGESSFTEKTLGTGKKDDLFV